jgi:hypothetical protein
MVTDPTTSDGFANLRQQIDTEIATHEHRRWYNGACLYVLTVLSFVAGVAVAVLAFFEGTLLAKVVTAALGIMCPSFAKWAELHGRLERLDESRLAEWRNLRSDTDVSGADIDKLIAAMKALRRADVAERSGAQLETPSKSRRG